MSSRINGEKFDNFISQAQAARIREVSRQAIADLIKRGRLQSVRLAGRTLVLRSEVETFIKLANGRPLKNAERRTTPEVIYLGAKEARQA